MHDHMNPATAARLRVRDTIMKHRQRRGWQMCEEWGDTLITLNQDPVSGRYVVAEIVYPPNQSIRWYDLLTAAPVADVADARPVAPHEKTPIGVYMKWIIWSAYESPMIASRFPHCHMERSVPATA